MRNNMLVRMRLNTDPTEELMDAILTRLHEQFPDAIDGWVWEDLGDRRVQIMLFGRFELDDECKEA